MNFKQFTMLILIYLPVHCQSCLAHTTAESYSRIYIDGDFVYLRYRMQLDPLLSKIAANSVNYLLLDSYVAGELENKFVLASAGNRCERRGTVNVRRINNTIEANWRVECTNGNFILLKNGAFFTLIPEHLHISRVTTSRGVVVEKLLTEADHTWDLSTTANSEDAITGSAFGAYLRLGIGHILSGYDHLAFLLAILLVCRQLKLIIWSITGFTLGHSLTLCAAVLGIATPPTEIIEALIGCTIALVAAEMDVPSRYVDTRDAERIGR